MMSTSLEDELRILIKEFDSVNDNESALFYSEELISRNCSDEDKHTHIKLLFQNAQYNECLKTVIKLFSFSDNHSVSSSTLYYIRSCIQLNKEEQALFEMKKIHKAIQQEKEMSTEQKRLYSQFYYYYGFLTESTSKTEAIDFYQESLRYNSFHIAASKRLLCLQNYTVSNEYLSTLSKASRELPTALQKRYCTYFLCHYHPYLIPHQQLQSITNKTLSPSFSIAVCQCLRERGELATALLLLQKVLEAGCLSSECIIEYAILLYQKNMGDVLYSFIHSFPPTQTHQAEYCYLLGVYTLLKHNFYESLQHFNLALVKRPRFWEAWIGIGLARSFLGEHEMAISAFAYASQSCPQNYRIRYHIVNEYKIMGRPKDALRELNECLKIDSVDPVLFNEKGVLCYELKRYEEAESAFVSVLKAIETFPPTEKQKWVSVYFNLAHVYRKQGKMVQAQRLLQEVGTVGGPLAKSASYHISLGLLYHTNKNMEEACVEYELALACDPSNGQAKQLFEMAVQHFAL